MTPSQSMLFVGMPWMKRMASPLPRWVQCTTLLPSLIDTSMAFVGFRGGEPTDTGGGPYRCPQGQQRGTKEHGSHHTLRAHAGINEICEPRGDGVSPRNPEHTQPITEGSLIKHLLDQTVKEATDAKHPQVIGK